MTDTQHDVGIRLSGDASGLVDATKEAAQSQKALEQQFKSTGEAAKQNAAEAERFVKGLRDQAAEFGKTKRQVEEYRASQLTLTDAQRASVKTSLDQIRAQEKQVALLSSLKLGFAAAIGGYVAAKIAMVKGAIDEMDELNKLRQQIGMSTEALSVYRYQTSLAGVSNEEFSLGMRNLARNVAEARSGVGDGAQIFALFGNQVEGAVKSGASMEQLLPLIAERFSQWGDGANKTALAMQLFGRAGERLIPFFNQGSAGIAQLRAEAERLGIVIGGEAARQAEEYNDNVRRLEVTATNAKYAIARDFLPALIDVTNEMIRGHREGGLLLGVWEGLKKSAQYMAGAGSEQQELDNALTELRRRYEVMARLNRNAEAGERNEGQRRALQAEIEHFERERNRLVDVLAIRNPVNTGAGDVEPPRAAAQAQAPGTQRQGEDPYAKLIQQIRERTAVSQLELESEQKLTEADRAAMQVMVALQQGTLKLTDAQKLGLAAELERMIVAGRAAQSREEDTRRTEEARKAHQEYLQAQFKELDQAKEANKSLREHNEELGLTTEQLGMLQAARAAQALAILRQREALLELNEGSEEDLRIARERIRLAEERVGLIYEGMESQQVADARKKEEEEAKRVGDDLNRAVTDGLMRGFERGESLAVNFRNNLVNAFQSAILRPTISAIIDPITAPWAALISQGGAGVQAWFASQNASPGQGWDEAGFENLDWTQMHGGGIVGVDGQRRFAHPAYIERAPRLHRGGLLADERPAILQLGEEVLTRRDPRHVANGGGAPSSIRVEIVNQGTPQEAVSATPSVGAEGMLLRVVTRDLSTNGPVAQTMQRTYGLNRSAGAVR